MKKIGLLFLLLPIGIITMQAQVRKRSCGSADALTQMISNNPAIAAARQEIEVQTKKFALAHANNASRSVNTITIPVVVHIVYNTTVQNISDTQVLSQIAILNQDYTQSNSDWSGTPDVFQTVSGNAGIQFCLAQRDPNGNTTTGIVRVPTATTCFTGDNAVKATSTGGDDAWPASSYLNLWVCNLGTNLLGYAQFPGGTAATDGVVINYTAFGNTGTAAAPYDKGRTATHEIGHWLNLYHIWGDDNGACTGTDHVDDTPNQGSENYGCPLFPHLSCSNGPNGDMFMNFMDYTDDACMFMFSAGQATRMQSLFAPGGARASILSSMGCSPPSVGTTACTIPSMPATDIVSSTSDTVSWQPVPGAISYILEYKPATASVWATTTSTTATKNLTGLAPGTTYTYQIEAVCNTGSSAYSPGSSFTTYGALVACTDTFEPNETRTAARQIPVNTDINGMISSAGDRDYFMFSNTAAQPDIKVTLSNLPGDYDLKLYSADGVLLFTSQNNELAPEIILYNNAPIATYYAYVYGNNNAYNNADCYTLNASIGSTAWKETTDDATGINDMKAEVQYNVYPNPNNGKFHLMISAAELLPKVTVKVTDMIGQTIQTLEYENVEGLYSYEIDLHTVAVGIYNVVISDGKNTETRKVIVQK
jgi:hypothetical protein